MNASRLIPQIDAVLTAALSLNAFGVTSISRSPFSTHAVGYRLAPWGEGISLEELQHDK